MYIALDCYPIFVHATTEENLQIPEMLFRILWYSDVS